MFTGIIEELGVVESAGVAFADPLRHGDERPYRRRQYRGEWRVSDGGGFAKRDSFRADLAPETLRRSNLGDLRAGSRVNLERPLMAGGRLNGHIVQGHVDGTGEFLSLEELGDDNWWLRIRVPAELDRYLVFKGSIAIDGISLTIAAIEDCVVSVTIIPHTYRNTTLGGYSPGARVNLECDILAKHVEKLMGR